MNTLHLYFLVCTTHTRSAAKPQRSALTACRLLMCCAIRCVSGQQQKLLYSMTEDKFVRVPFVPSESVLPERTYTYSTAISAVGLFVLCLLSFACSCLVLLVQFRFGAKPLMRLCLVYRLWRSCSLRNWMSQTSCFTTVYE